MGEPVREVTDAQRSKLFAAARELGLDNDELHALVKDVTGKTSVRQLTMDEAGHVIDALVQRGASSGARHPLPAGVPRLVTPWQLARIRDLIHTLGWQDARPLYEGVIKRALGGPVYPRTSAEAGKVIEAFKAIMRRRIGDTPPREGQG